MIFDVLIILDIIKRGVKTIEIRVSDRIGLFGTTSGETGTVCIHSGPCGRNNMLSGTNLVAVSCTQRAAENESSLRRSGGVRVCVDIHKLLTTAQYQQNQSTGTDYCLF